MPIIKSAKKRVRVTQKAATRNSKTKRSLKSAVKAFHASLTGGATKSGEKLSKAQSEIDKAAKKNVIHKNKAARKKSQLAKAAKAAGTKPAAKKTVAKKTTAKATTAKKPAAKAPAKKPAAKKAATKK
jgi:small subunit ribosomal protein S20